MQPFFEKLTIMTRKELIYRLCNEHNEQTIKLLHDFPTLLRDLWIMEDYEETLRLYQQKKIHAKKQWTRDLVVERYGIGVNTFYDIRKRVEWVLTNLDKALSARNR